MKASLFEKLRQPTTVVLSAGHGAGDTGTVNGDFKEADEAIIIVDEIAKQLKKKGITVDVVPHENGLKTAIKYVNARYDGGDAWAIEIHRGSTDGLPVKQASLRCGAYYYPSQGSTDRHLHGQRLETLWSSRHDLGAAGYGVGLHAIGMDPGHETGRPFARARLHGGRQFQAASPQAGENRGAIRIRSFHRRRLGRRNPSNRRLPRPLQVPPRDSCGSGSSDGSCDTGLDSARSAGVCL